MMDQSVEYKYRRAFMGCRPRHEQYDEFSLRHPKMQLSQRAKIFSPFDALKGFTEAIDSKRKLYVERRELNEEEQAALNAALCRLYTLSGNRRAARENHVTATAVFYVPCADEYHEAYGCRGSYETISGPVLNVDPVLTETLLIGDRVIDFADIAAITIQEE